MKPARHTPGILLALLACGLPARAGEAEPTESPNPRASFGATSMLSPEQLDEVIQPDGKTGHVTNGVLDLRGPIDRVMRQRFEEAVATGNVTTVRITSQGGDIVEALRIALAMQDRAINVVVHDLCTGACAQYIFIAGRKRQLEKRSLVGFIGTIKSAGTLLGMAIDTLEEPNPAAYAMGQLAALEEQLYQRRGVAVSLLLDPHVALQPRCVVLQRGATGVSWSITNTYNLWVPSREYLKAAGVEFEGDWPKSHFTMGGLAFHYLKARSSNFVRYADKDHLRSRKQKPYKLEDVRKCVLDQLPPDSGAPPG